MSLQPYLLLVFVILLLAYVVFSTIYYSRNFLPPPAAWPGTKVPGLFNITTLATGFIFFLTQILLFWFAYKYRTRPGRKAVFFKNLMTLEIIWISVPTVVFVFLFVWGQSLWAEITKAPTGDVLELEVTGAQFSWHVRYPGEDNKLGRADFRYISNTNFTGVDMTDPDSKDDFIPVQMHVPKDRPVMLLLRSRDVIHSFYIPHFRTKMDAVPGMITRMHFTPLVTTAEMRAQLNNPDFNYEIACAELCGRMHFGMKMILVVDEPEEYDRWCQEQKGTTDELRGIKDELRRVKE